MGWTLFLSELDEPPYPSLADAGWLAIYPCCYAAELHDIGKMAIPDTILNKPGPLDDAEWAFMHRHTVIGEAILSAAPGLVPVARIVRASHERFDGTGSPDGRAGAEIPIAARIVAVCDAFDAMTGDRSYRRGMAPRAALAELRRAPGHSSTRRWSTASAPCTARGSATPPNS